MAGFIVVVVIKPWGVGSYIKAPIWGKGEYTQIARIPAIVLKIVHHLVCGTIRHAVAVIIYGGILAADTAAVPADYKAKVWALGHYLIKNAVSLRGAAAF